MGLTARLAAAIHDTRHPSYIDHPLRDLLAQRIYQIASGYADGNDANSLRHDPLFKLGVERLPLEPDQNLASAPTFSRLEHSVDRKDVYRFTQALVDHFVGSYPEPPVALVLDLDHTDDPTHGQQELAFYHHYYKNYCYLPLFIFKGTSPWRGERQDFDPPPAPPAGPVARDPSARAWGQPFCDPRGDRAHIPHPLDTE
jgi:hypothetical protein